MNLYQIYRLLLRKKWFLIVIPILCTFLSVFVTNILPESYKSTTQLSTGFTKQVDVKITDERFNFRDALNKFNNMVQTMRSDVILSTVAYELLLHDMSTSPPFRIPKDTLNGTQYAEIDVTQILNEKIKSRTVLFTSVEEEFKIINLLKQYGYLSWQLLEDLVISRVADTDYVNITFTSEDPYLSSFIVNRIAELYINYDSFMKSNLSTKSVSFFQEQLDAKQIVIDHKIREIKIFKELNSINNYSSNATVIAKITEYEF